MKHRYLITRILAMLFVAVGVLLDQFSKIATVEGLKGNDSFVLIDGVLQLTYHENRGAAFGILSDARWVFLSISTVAILAILFYIFYKKDMPTLWLVSLSMIASGGIGNMIDRIALGYVVDFIDFCLINFAIFNVADSFVTVGAFLMILALVYEIVIECKKAKKK